jgi:DUF1365 family protein
MAASAIYTGWVMHRRLRPRMHHFRYRVFSLLLDLDELPSLSRLRLFGWNKAALFSFQDRDHGDGRPLKAWLDSLLAAAGLAAHGPKRVLCYPRIFGYVFNPLSVWFCHTQDGALKAVVYEVHNTYGERHAYVVPCGGGGVKRHAQDKDFYVSPFLSQDCRYHFRTLAPDAQVVVAIQEQEAGQPILTASFKGRRRALGDGALLAMLLRYPLMTLKVVVAIHYEAVRLMLKGIQRHPHLP